MALAIDDLTENVFIITQNHEPLDQVIKITFLINREIDFTKKMVTFLFSTEYPQEWFRRSYSKIEETGGEIS